MDGSYGGLYDSATEVVSFGVVISLITIIFAAIFDQALLFGFILLILINVICRAFLQDYTNEGNKVKSEVKGFKLYLETAEVDRMKIIGTPPTKTPQLYEKYLPYAMALGVEKQWTQQFTPIFRKLAAQGHEYHPTWFVEMLGSSRWETIPLDFGSQLSQSLSSVIITSSSNVPGSSSGSDGGGSSGGGGGGGGGGGW